MADKGEMSWTDWRGKTVTREINWTIDVRKHRGEPGFGQLLIAANTHLSISDLGRLLQSQGTDGSSAWIRRRRWLFQPAEAWHSRGYPNADGRDEKARRIMLENKRLSVRQLVSLLSESWITRSREWVRQWRYADD